MDGEMDDSVPSSQWMEYYVPYSSHESIIERSKEANYLGLRQTQASVRTDAPNWQPWLTFFPKSLQHQKARLEKKIARERLILGDLPELSVQILELCREHGRVTVADATRVTGANRNTIKVTTQAPESSFQPVRGSNALDSNASHRTSKIFRCCFLAVEM